MTGNAETTFRHNGQDHPLTCHMVATAALRLTPAHSTHFRSSHTWYALVGTHLYYVGDLIAEAIGVRPHDPSTARHQLKEIGFPVFALGYGPLMDGHPGHTN